MSTYLYRIGSFSARRRKLVLPVGLLSILAIALLGRSLGGEPVDDFEVPGVESQMASDLLRAGLPGRAGATAMVVFHVPGGPGASDGAGNEAVGDPTASVTDPGPADAIASVIDEISAIPEVLSVTGALDSPMSISPDGRTTFASVQFSGSASEMGHSTLDELLETAKVADGSGVHVEFGGELPNVLKEESTGHSELIGILAALVILMITLRSGTATLLAPASAIAGLATGLSLVALISGIIDIPSVAPKLGTMIGLGVGIDYALFVISRHRDNLSDGMDVVSSIAATNATAGKAVVIAGMTVVFAILGLQMAGIPFVAALGYAASVVVAVAVVIAVVLVPALLGFAGRSVLPRSDRQGHTSRPPSGSGPRPKGIDSASSSAPRHARWVSWARWVSAHPWPSLLAATASLLLLSVPVLDMSLGQADAGSAPAEATRRKAYDLLADAFGPGFNGPLLLAVDLGSQDDRFLNSLTSAVIAVDGVKAASPPEVSPSGETALISVIPTSKPQDPATTALVERLRNETIPTVTSGTDATVYLGGPTAGFIDQSEKIAGRLPWFILAVVMFSFVLLATVFRSVLVPLKAAVLNLLAIGAAYGVVVAVFQWGWGRSLIGLDEAVPIASFVPMMMFAILFGLSMDYEVFILSRVREEYSAGRSNIDSVVAGLGATASVITAAALIMVTVFIGFVASPDPIVKMMGVGLASAVAIDATVVRMVLVPSTMALVGDPNWWFPSWLDRLLPAVELD